MGAINTVDARRLFTKTLIDVYRESTMPTNFLRSFFEPRETSSKEVSIEVQRNSENIAVDVLRGTEGNRNTMDRFSEKVFIPPYYREYFDATQLFFYDQLFGRGDVEMDEMTLQDWIQEVMERMQMLQAKIERSVEKQCSEVLQTGIVLLDSTTNINFRRKATSIVDLTGGSYWDDTGVDPIPSIEAGCTFLRQQGKMLDGVVNMILGEKAYTSLLANSDFQQRIDFRRVPIVDLSMPQRLDQTAGAAFHGEFSAGAYIIRVWTYPQFYEATAGAGATTPYINTRNMILLPMQTRFRLAYAAVPKLIRDTRNAEFPEFIMQQRGAYTIGNYIDERTETHVFDIKSAPLAIPVAVDQIYTATVTTA